jgi:hypothetical protein
MRREDGSVLDAAGTEPRPKAGGGVSTEIEPAVVEAKDRTGLDDRRDPPINAAR